MIEIALKSLVVVLVLAVPAFYISQRISSGIVTPHEFATIRNIWFAVTIAAFLCGNQLVFSGILIGVCLYAHAARVAHVSLFIVILLAVPLVRVDISDFSGGTRLIELDHPRVLSIFLLLPLLYKVGFRRRPGDGFVMPDVLILTYVVGSAFLETRDDEVTNLMRVLMRDFLDILVPYYAFSRTVTRSADIRKVFLAFAIAALPLALIAVLELVKYWRLYSVVATQWGSLSHGYLARDGLLRAAASAFSPIVLGMVLMVAIGCMLALRKSIASRQFSMVAFAVLGIGLVATLSRGPWVGTAALLLVALASSPNGMANLGKVAGVGGILFVFLLPTPLGQSIVSFLPFVGTVETHNVNYRADLFVNSLAVIDRHFWIGSTDYRAAAEFDQLRQHGGTMVDIVNHFVKIALDGGAFGLSLFLGFFIIIILNLWRVQRMYRREDNETRSCAIALLAMLLAIMVLLATMSSVDYIPFVYWTFGGLSVAFVRSAYRERAAAVARSVRMRQVPA